ncbi:MAG: biopolymer transporter ExbD [bacterium]
MNFRGKFKPDTVGFQIAPLVDIMLFLLCFFITLQIYMQWETEIDIKLPTAENTNVESRRLPGEIILNLKKTGEVAVNGRVHNDAELLVLLKQLVNKDTGFPGQPVLIRADRDTSYQKLIHVLDLCRGSDIWNISFAISAEEKVVK